jgi:hypothetical protein
VSAGHVAARFRRLDLDRLAMAAFVVVILVFAGARTFGMSPWDGRGVDLYAYWTTRDGLAYSTAHQGDTGAYLYSPAFAQAISPLTMLPWRAFAGIWTLLAAAPLLWLGGRYAVLLLLLPPIAMSVLLGQLDLVFAAAVVAGFRWPAAWALLIVTKITPVVGLVWFLVRREWRSLGTAIGVTVVVVAASAFLDPAGWIAWLELLRRMEFPVLGGNLWFLPVPLWLRLPAAAALVAWGALTDRRWTVPVGVCLALPTVWLNSPTILVAVLPLVEAGARTPAGRWLRSEGSTNRRPLDLTAT